ncbi:MAG: SRPBCC family protein [Euryarchaeota archaeon]|nr:SRPBCC family protein [Euryarchaeota archaeon]
MVHVEASIEVNATRENVYGLWTRFEDLPRFMTGIDEVWPVTNRRLRVLGKVAGKPRRWSVQVMEDMPYERIAWQSVDGIPIAGTIHFTDSGQNKTRVLLRLDVDPTTWMGKAGANLGLLKYRMNTDLRRFKEYMETPGRMEPKRNELAH